MRSLTPPTEKDPIDVFFEDQIAWLTFDLPGEKVNKLSSGVMASLARHLEALKLRADLEGAVLCSGKEGVFIAGADINEIEGITDSDAAVRASKMGQEIFGRIGELPFPVVAAIDGVCLGGGTELALACHGRIGTDNPRFRIGLPEVNLGIIPAWGGTTRLPRQIGLQRSLEMILTGRPVNARKAKRMGLIDAAVPRNDLRRQARIWIDKLRQGDRFQKQRRRRAPGFLGWLLEGNPLGRMVVFRAARKTVLSRSGGHYPAPLKALEVARRGWNRPISKALDLEAEAAGPLIVSPISKNLIHLFFLSEKAKKDPGVDGESGPQEAVRAAGLLGAGTMGGGIAWLCSHRDIPVRVKDLDTEALGAGLKEAYRIHERRRKRRRLTKWERDKKMGLISPTLDWSGFRGTDVLIEAIVEDLEIKKKVLSELEPAVSRRCLIGSNTSTLPISELQGVLENPQRMAGFHFFNPVDRMPLVEVIRGEATSDEAIAGFVAFAKQLGKTPVVVKDCPGFLVNRILGPYLNEACHLLMETGDLAGIDQVLLGFGMPMGPLRLLDEVGVDVAAKASKVLADAYRDRSSPALVIEELVSVGRLGKKSGRGLYRHQGAKAEPDSEVLSVIGAEPRRSVDAAETIQRCIYLMVSEAVRCLEEGVVRSPGELDLAMVMGIGFPPFRGGLCRYADSVGLQSVVDGLRGWRDKLGSRFEPASELVERAGSGKGFYG
jgi:3-hydroxyacyl-CoA dehydrogenase/enoyl-CoA hydratase/3-hydroxybutyryl-CoA epimerase